MLTVPRLTIQITAPGIVPITSVLWKPPTKDSERFLGAPGPWVSGRARRRQPEAGICSPTASKDNVFCPVHFSQAVPFSPKPHCRLTPPLQEWLLENWSLPGLTKTCTENILRSQVNRGGLVAERRRRMIFLLALLKNLYWWCVSDVFFFFFCTALSIVQRFHF